MAWICLIIARLTDVGAGNAFTPRLAVASAASEQTQTPLDVVGRGVDGEADRLFQPPEDSISRMRAIVLPNHPKNVANFALATNPESANSSICATYDKQRSLVDYNCLISSFPVHYVFVL